MLAGKTLTEFTNLFSPNNFKKLWYNFKLFYDSCVKIHECNFNEHDFDETANMYPTLSANTSNDQQFKLNKINEIKNYLLRILKKEN